MKPLLIIILLFISTFSFAQEEEVLEEKEIKAIVVNAQTDAVMGDVHVINLNKVKGTITKEDGEFTISASVDDILYFSFLGFKSQKIRVTNDMFKFKDTKIALTELAYALEEVIVKPYQLTGYLEIDVKNAPINNAYQYSISGLSVGYEGGNKNPSAVTKVLGAILNPADLLRNLFGKQPNQMKKLRKIKEDDQIRDLLASKFDREVLTELLQIEKLDIQDILNNCNYSKSFIRTANDLQILDAISSCYEDFKVLNRKK
ncbi:MULTISPECIES: carboxypeptidase-like regulatory domain-containing protein [Zobellia]|uniref:carboxypeptidase-like regulatory domain-containing protein n=1 Tax=Zobellia TaxID=112040 RepID=UPI001BFFD42B|nr:MULTISPECIES: carboxypeptidase-like regulatory domain-containing protein [Zobellia]MBT9188477.1 carboxypeptidase-like regulatory domain-containing protein [Zobellia russellii]MBU2976312.1 carboxypeptidase-like regulatory domain-containing protein [Zobellia sp. B3R18]MDO6819307.1 carboxypeptidase-like regulatory domain-containing protein [Zobellia sp. 1_MG-2023]